MTLRFAGKGARLAGAASAAAIWLILPLGCATGDSPLQPDPPGGDSGAPPFATEAGSSDDPTQGDDAQVGPDVTPSGDPDSSVNADGAPPGPNDASDAGGVDGADAALASDSSGGNGVLCGGGATATLRCSGAKPTCCETSGAYACVAAGACGAGYSIACAAAPDCAGGDACCHYNSGIKCVPSCPLASSMCDPAVPGSCGAGHSCNVPVALSGSATPYRTCSP